MGSVAVSLRSIARELTPPILYRWIKVDFRIKSQRCKSQTIAIDVRTVAASARRQPAALELDGL
jgi:hypothetical protein